MANQQPETSAKNVKSVTQSSVDAFRLPPPKQLTVVEEGMDKKWNKWLKNFKWWSIAVKFGELPADEKMAIFMTTMTTIFCTL
jgi:hypothetical protein